MWMPTASTPASRTCCSTDEVVGRLELHLHRQPARLLDRRRALGDVQRAAVAAVDRAGRQRRVHGAVEVARRRAHLGELRRRLDRDRLRAARQLDAAEAALLVRAPVDALLHDGRGDRVEVQQRDLPVRDAVRRLTSRRSSAAAGSPPGRRSSSPRYSVGRALAEPQRVGRGLREARVHGHGQRQPAHPHEAGVGRARRRRGGRAPRVVPDSSSTRTPSDCSSTSSRRSSMSQRCAQPRPANSSS